MLDLYSNKRPTIISIVSTKSGMGKTTLIERLIKEFKNRGYKVGALKHDAHKFEIDKEGKDSWRFTNAGANDVVVASCEKLAMVKTLQKEKDIEEIISYFSNVDILFIEGFRENNYPKIEVHRKCVDDNLLCKNKDFNLDTFLAVATDEEIEGILNLNLNNVEAMTNLIEKSFFNKKEKKIYLNNNKLNFKTLEVKVVKLDEKINKDFDELIVYEYPLTIFLNNKNIATLLCTPKNIKELIVGFLKTKGYIDKIEDVYSVQIDEHDGSTYVKAKDIKYNKNKIHTEKIYLNSMEFIECTPVEGNMILDYEKVYYFMEKNLNYSDVFKNTGGVHNVALADETDIIVAFEDVARHNALDKVIGYSLINYIYLKDKIVVLSGRVSLEMILKAAKLQIPIIISKSAPTNLAIQLAKKLNITLVGFVRGKRMNIYANEHRIAYCICESCNKLISSDAYKYEKLCVKCKRKLSAKRLTEINGF